ncbi:hypothetical protein BD779DRAFT_1477168 [Infundibulicybe gibba]|nr:hypothetical protein BD779DRAFT_1477168 [Infundibulicybe gibba]
MSNMAPETPSSTLATLCSVRSTRAQPGEQKWKGRPSEGAFGARNNDDGDDNYDIAKMHQCPQGVKRSRADSGLEAKTGEVPVPRTVSLVSKMKRRKTLSDLEQELRRNPDTEDNEVLRRRKILMDLKPDRASFMCSRRQFPGVLTQCDPRTWATSTRKYTQFLRKGGHSTDSKDASIWKESDSLAGQKGHGGAGTLGKPVEGSTRGPGETWGGGGQASGGDSSGRRSEHTQLSGKGKHAEDIGSGKTHATLGDMVPHQGSGALAGRVECGSTVTLGKSVKESTREKRALDGKATLSQRTSPIPGSSHRSEDDWVIIAAELALTRDALSRHRAQIRFSSSEISHLEAMEKELCAKMDTPRGGGLAPSDSPGDFQTLVDLHKRPEFYKTDPSWTAIDPVPIITTPTYDDLTAPAVVTREGAGDPARLQSSSGAGKAAIG